jgi:hypothetical protein
MPIRVPSHLYRNRHGTFYFRAIIPKSVRDYAGRTEVRFSLLTELRQAAIITALPLIADLPRLALQLQQMADNSESLPSDFFKQWQLQMLQNAKLRMDIIALKVELQECQSQMSEMLSISKARRVVHEVAIQ